MVPTTSSSPDVPADVLAQVARAAGVGVRTSTRLPGGRNAGASRVEFEDGAVAVLKAEPRTHADRFGDVQRTRRIVEHLRTRGYPTPAWLAVGETTSHVWHLAEFVDGAPVRELTPAVVGQLLDVVALQAGQGIAGPDHSRYARDVVTGREPVVADLAGGPPPVTLLTERALSCCARGSPPPGSPDAVHADLAPGNVLVRDGVVVGLVDVGNAGRGTRATDLTTLLWHAVTTTPEDVRAPLWRAVHEAVGAEGAVVLAVTQVLLQVQWPLRLGLAGTLAVAVDRGHRLLDDLEAVQGSLAAGKP